MHVKLSFLFVKLGKTYMLFYALTILWVSCVGPELVICILQMKQLLELVLLGGMKQFFFSSVQAAYDWSNP